MNTKQAAALFFLLLIGGVFFYIQAHKLLSNTSTSSSVASSTAPWITYENTKYHYSLSYPRNGGIACEGYEIPPVGECLSLRIGGKGMLGQIGINVIPLTFPTLTSEQRKVLSLNLRDFAEHERNAVMKNVASNSNISSPGALSTTTIASQVAYGFNSTGRVGVGFFSDGEMAISSGVNSYFAIQNKNGDKFIIIFPAGDPIAQKIVDSFRFINALNTTPIEN